MVGTIWNASEQLTVDHCWAIVDKWFVGQHRPTISQQLVVLLGNCSNVMHGQCQKVKNRLCHYHRQVKTKLCS